MLATAMQAADATIVNVALPQLERDLGGGIELGAWVMTSYLCAAAVAAPLTGWLCRRFGARRLYRSAVLLFVLASLLCAVAPSGVAVVAFRLLQGAGGGAVPALAQAVLHDLYPRERHGRMLAIWGAVAMLGPILGPALGGVIADLASWRAVFLVNLPLGALALWRVGRALPGRGAEQPAHFDAVGLVLLILGIGALQLWLQRGIGRPWLHSPELLAEAAVVILTFAAAASRISRSEMTVLRLDVFADLNFAAAAFYNFLTSGLVFTAIVFLPVLAQGPLGYPATLAGLTIVPRGIWMMLVVLATGQIVGRVDYRLLLTVGLLAMAVGLVLLSEIRPGGNDIVLIILGSTVQAIGAGLILMPLSTVAVATLPSERRVDATGVYSLLRQLGCASALAVMTAVLQRRVSLHTAALAPALDTAGQSSAQLADKAVLHAYADCFRIMAVAALAVVPGILFFRPARLRAGEPIP